MVGKRLEKKSARKAAIMIHKGVPIAKAMQKIGYSKTTAYHKQQALTGKPIFKQEFEAVRAIIAASCLKHGVTVDRMVKKVAYGLDARIQFKNKSIPDHEVQIKWWDRGAVLLGMTKEKDEVETGIQKVINVHQLFQIVVDARRERGLEI